jgi:hypothetical protein
MRLADDRIAGQTTDVFGNLTRAMMPPHILEHLDFLLGPCHLFKLLVVRWREGFCPKSVRFRNKNLKLLTVNHYNLWLTGKVHTTESESIPQNTASCG